MTKKTTEVATVAPTAVSTEVKAPDLNEWGVPEISAKDTIIAKIFPMQMMSKKVADGQAVFGEFRDSVTNEKLGDFANPVEFIPISVTKVWIESTLENGKDWKYQKSYGITAENDNLPYGEVIAGVRTKRVRTYNALVLLASEALVGIPRIISFRVSSMRAGQKLLTQMYVANRQAKLSPAAKAMKLVGSKQKNDKGTFVVLDVEVSRNATGEEQAKALEWFKLMSSQPQNFKVDEQEENLSDPVAETASEVVDNQF